MKNKEKSITLKKWVYSYEAIVLGTLEAVIGPHLISDISSYSYFINKNCIIGKVWSVLLCLCPGFFSCSEPDYYKIPKLNIAA